MTNQNSNINPDLEIGNQISKKRKLRLQAIYKSHYWFFNIYFSHYVSYSTAPFQKEMFLLTQDMTNKLLVVVSFRGSAKTSVMSLSYPIWAIIGEQRIKYVLIISRTMEQAKQIMKNIKDELERNDLLRRDLGPFQESGDWRSSSLDLPKYGARITVASSEQSLRGIRHGHYRPELIILDDIEDLNSVKTQESRDNTFKWITGDIIPLGDKNTKIIIIGNMLHEDSAIMRLRKNIEEGKMDGIFKEYPLVDKNNNILWPGKFPDMASIEEQKRKVGNEISWQREYMLRIVSDAGRVVHPEWLKYYSGFPSDKDLLFTVTGVDLAVSEKNSADYTAMVSASVYKLNGELFLYILPNPVNEKLPFPEAVEKIKLLSKSVGNGYPTEMAIEDVGYQRSIIQQLQDEGFPAEGFAVKGQDKRARLALTTHMIKSGHILFPKKGVEKLIHQLTGFGSEKHDDLADAFTIAVLQTLKNGEDYLSEPEIFLA